MTYFSIKSIIVIALPLAQYNSSYYKTEWEGKEGVSEGRHDVYKILSRNC
jgi:hypothetical protein